MATEVVKIVDPDNGSGTNYTSLSAFESGEQRDLVTADEIAVAKCRCTNGTADTTAVTIDGWTTDSTRYVKIYCDPSDAGGDGRSGTYIHKGVWPSSGKIYRLNQRLLTYEYTHIYDVACKNATSLGGGTIQSETGGAIILRRVYAETTSTGNAFRAYLPSATCYAYNCIFVAAGGYDHGTCAATYSQNYHATYFYNCTAYCTGDAYSAFVSFFSSRNIYCYNCIGKIAGSIYTGGAVFKGYSGGIVYGDYTIASDSSYPSGASNYWTGTTPTFVDAANKDFHLAASDTAAKNAGYDYSSAGYSDDIDGQTRSGTWDIGADEYVSSQVSLNALIQKALAATTSLDALLSGSIPLQISLDALVRALGERSSALDALLKASGRAGVSSLDALLARAGVSLSHSIDALLARSGLNVSSGLDALLNWAAAAAIESSLDALLFREGVLATLSLDALAARASGLSSALDSFLQSLASSAVSLDAVIYALSSGQVDTVLDALARKAGLTASAAADAVLQARRIAGLALDAAIGGAMARSLALDAALYRQDVTLTAQIDAWIASLGAAASELDALLVKGFGLSAGLDAVLGGSGFENIALLDGLLAKGMIRQASLDAIVYGELAHVVDVDALLSREGDPRVTLLDAIVYSALATAYAKRRFVARRPRPRLVARRPRPHFAASGSGN